MLDADSRSQSILSSIPSPIAVLDSDGVVLQVNESWARYARENNGSRFLADGVGTNYLEICENAEGLYAEEAPDAAIGIRSVLSGTKDIFSLEYPCHSPTEQRWFFMTVTPLNGTDNEVVVIHLDVTERKLAEMRQTSLDEILEQSLDEIYIFDAQTLHFIYVNEGAQNNLGYSLDELKALTPIDITPEFTRVTFDAELEPLRTGARKKLDFVTLQERKDGTAYPVEVHVQSTMFEGNPVFSQINLDITERTQTEQALAQSRLFLESAPDASIIVNSEGKVKVANSHMSSLFGYSPDELRGMPIEQLIPERFRGSHVAHRETYDADPTVRSMGADLDLFALTKDGSEIPIEVTLSPIQTGDGVLVAAAIRDITVRKTIEDALVLTKEKAESATAGKSRFLAAASHDLRQPLQAITMYLSVLTRIHDQPKQKEVGEKMQMSLDTMGELLDALLDISQLDGGSVVPEKRDIAAREILDRIVAENVQQAEAKGLTLDWTCEDCTIHTDPALVERVIENFVTNAIRYTESGGITIDCQHSDGVALISVTDTGIGMPTNALDKVFDEYYQLDNDVRDRRKGLGLGLSIVKHIARLLDHSLDVTSVQGKGSTFSVEIPFGTTEIVAESLQPARTLSDSTRSPIILLVDDDPAVIDATSMMLEGMGIEVHAALCGEEALAHLTAGISPDIVVSDYRLPDYNGVEVVKRVRAATLNDLPSVIMTGDTSAKEIEVANLTNCTVLHKPINTNQLIELIDSLTALSLQV